MYSMILLGAAVLIVLLCAGIAALFGLPKAKARLIITVVCAFVAIGACWGAKLLLPTPDTIMTLVQDNLGTIEANFGDSAAQAAEKALEFASISPTLAELAIQLTTALALPLLCVVLFALLFAVAWFVCWLVMTISAIFHKKRSKDDDMDEDESLPGKKKHTVGSRLIAAGLGLVQGVVIVVVLLIPISGYLGLAEPTLNEMTAQGVLPADDPTIEMVQDIITDVNQSPVLTVYRKAGGNILTDTLMTMRVANTNVKLSEELTSMLSLAKQVLELSKVEFADYSEEQAEMIVAIGDTFAESKLLSPIVGDLLFAATDAWLQDEAFLGMERPSLDESGELIDPLLIALLDILHSDAKNAELLQADVKTTAELISVMAKNGVFAKMSEPEKLIEALSGDAISEMVTSLGNNNSMKRLIPEIMNLGVRAIGQVLKIPADTNAVHNSFTGTVADALNEVRDLPEAERIAVLSEKLNVAFDLAGVDVDSQVMTFYSTAMLHDLINNNSQDVTPDDVQAFFVLYAEGVHEAATVASSAPSIQLLSNTKASDRMAGTVYERMTEAERKNSAAVAVASLCVKLSGLQGDKTEIAAQATVLVEEAFANILVNNPEAMAIVVSVEITAPISENTTSHTASMQSSEELSNTSSVVTLEDLLIDTKAAAENITSETVSQDAAAISAIFNTAAELSSLLNGSTEDLDIAQLGAAIGQVLDALEDSASFGKEKTANLFTSVLQSETVRDKANIDMKTATELAKSATESEDGEDIDYTKTMSTIAGAANIVEKMGADGGFSEEELIELIRGLNKQTANMIAVYVTPARLVENNVPEKFSDISSQFIKALFGYIGDPDEEITDTEKEAKALNQILTIGLAARDSDDKRLFSSAPGADDGKLPTATETVTTLLDSHAVRSALIEVMTDGQKVVVFDPYELSNKIKPGTPEYQEALTAVYAYRDAHAGEEDLTDLHYEALAALLGLEIDLTN